MALSAGTRLGPYAIAAQIGVGGMGEVYRAQDTRLNRTVAIKILPAAITDDADAQTRFKREARAIAALDHPHICAVYDVGQHDGMHYLVMQHLDGETLAARLNATKAPLPLDQVLTIAIALADALDKVHRAGITHRDLKPGNIMLTKTGAKLLDFGLAKPQVASAALSHSAMTDFASATPKTANGIILGTVPYMAPEQVEGQPADARSDIWAFGAVVYEMATGQRPFGGDSPASVIGAILRDHPPAISLRQPRAPRTFDDLVDRCFAKDPQERWQSMGDVKYLLTSIASMSEGAPPSLETPRRARVSRWLSVAGAALLSAAIAVLVTKAVVVPPPASPPRPAVRLAIDLGRDAAVATEFPFAALSPDATRIVFVSTSPDGTNRLATRRLDQSEELPLTGTEGAYAPFFSPDGVWVGFFAGGKLKKVQLDGGVPVILCDAPAGRGASWGEDGRIVAALDNRSGLSLVTADGGIVQQVTELGPGEFTHRTPQMLPGGKAVLFLVSSAPGSYAAASVGVASLGTSPARARIVLPNVGMFPRYVGTGHVVYVGNGTLYAVPFDLDRLEVRGTARAVMDDVSTSPGFGFAQLDFSTNGHVLYRSGGTTGRTIVQWLTADARLEPLAAEPAFYQFPQLSPDGNRLLVVLADGAYRGIWVYQLQRGTKTRVTAGTGVNSYPIWSADGEHIVFQLDGQLHWVRADGAERPQPLIKTAGPAFPASFTPDGSRLMFFELSPGGGSLIQTVRIGRESGGLTAGSPELFRKLTAGNPFPTFSPDGRWVASTESGLYEVFVRAFPDTGKQWAISTGGGGFPVWSRTRKELFYRTEDQLLMATSYSVSGDSFVAVKPRVWSDVRLVNTGLISNFTLAPDGDRFAVLMSAESAEPGVEPRAMLVLNFFDEIRRRMAAPPP